MRMRRKPYAGPELAAWPLFMDTPAALRGQWADTFARPGQPLQLELGCGKGSFLAQLALQNPHMNYLGVDIKNEVLVVAKRNIEKTFHNAEKKPENVQITSYNIEKIADILADDDHISRIYINFCNPWYKTGHAKHRLTHPRQLVQYRKFLLPESEIWLKTDDTPLFEDSLRYFSLCGFTVTWKSWNLHADEPAWNIRTEHEQMFSAEGISIKACRATMLPAELDEAAIAKWRTI